MSLYNSMKGDLRIEINEKELAKLVVIAGGEEVYPSINIMKWYISLQGKEVEQKKLDSFIEQIEVALQKKKVGEDDPYLDKVRTILITSVVAKVRET